MKVKYAMHRGAISVGADTSLAKVAKKMREHDIGAVPVCTNRELVGIVTDRDVCCRGLGGRRDINRLTAGDIMSKPTQVCKEDDNLASAVKTMRQSKVRRLPVLDAKQNLIGMLSLDDLAAKVGMIVSGNALRVLAIHD